MSNLININDVCDYCNIQLEGPTDTFYFSGKLLCFSCKYNCKGIHERKNIFKVIKNKLDNLKIMSRL